MCIGFVVLVFMFLFRIVAFVSLCIGLGWESQPMQEYVYWEKDVHDPDLWWKWSSKKRMAKMEGTRHLFGNLEEALNIFLVLKPETLKLKLYKPQTRNPKPLKLYKPRTFI